MRTYRTAQVAQSIGVHANTVRLYAALGLIPKAQRRANGYRIFSDFHIEQFRLARMALQIEVLQNGLRKNIIEVVKTSASYLQISIDTLQNWEMNGLLTIKRRQNGYRVYTAEDMKRLKIIRTLRCANYSPASILRMLNTLAIQPDTDIRQVINAPQEDEMISVCDKLLLSLQAAKINAILIRNQLEAMKAQFS